MAVYAHAAVRHHSWVKHSSQTLSSMFIICFRFKPWLEWLRARASHNCEKPSHGNTNVHDFLNWSLVELFCQFASLKILFGKAEHTEMDQFICCNLFSWAWCLNMPFLKKKKNSTEPNWWLHQDYFLMNCTTIACTQLLHELSWRTWIRWVLTCLLTRSQSEWVTISELRLCQDMS